MKILNVREHNVQGLQENINYHDKIATRADCRSKSGKEASDHSLKNVPN